MAKKAKYKGDDGMDAFLDVLFNVIGILVLIVAFAALQSLETNVVREAYLGVKASDKKKLITIICAKRSCVELDQKDHVKMAENFHITIKNKFRSVKPKLSGKDWMSYVDIANKGALNEFFEKKSATLYNVSLLIYEDSFNTAGVVEVRGRKKGYKFRHLFFTKDEPISIGMSTTYVN
ncbi:hypothetical protein [Candidatus Thioglobus sp.]|jgi:hypothetical protein|uniref:hypothetical protein n=1 Tax=Candidatus Thioglobus sp. TaxID=2026721 RepID=UPI00175AA6DB|nr:hypothetical protein [Candidatus Thioglobus sp.]HIF47666.1 hypothetical protein [Candidatus Thioglobus sp.]HIL03125.1 hypothetical protein [Candidatus Thioglobus autotrophicus]